MGLLDCLIWLCLFLKTYKVTDKIKRVNEIKIKKLIKMSRELGGSILSIESDIFGINLLVNKTHKKNIGKKNPLIISYIFK